MAKNVVIDIQTSGGDKTEKELKKVSKAVGDVQKQSKDLGKGSEALKEGFKAVDQAAGGLLTQLKALIMNPIVLVITGIVAALAAFKNALASSEEGQEMWGEAMAKVTTYIKVFADFLSNKLIKSIKDAGGVIEWLKNQLDALVGAVKSVIDWYAELGTKLLKADIVGIYTQVAETVVKVSDAVKDSVTDFVDGVAELNKKAEEAAQKALELEQRANKLNRDKRQALIDESKLNRQLASERAKVADATLSIEERQASLNAATEIANKIAANQVALKAREIDILRQQQALTNNTAEDNDKLAKLEAELNNIYAARDNMLREMVGQKAALAAQEKAMAKAAIDAANAADQAERERLQSLHEFKVSLMEEGMNKRLELLEIEKQAELEQAMALAGSAEELAELEWAIEEKYLAKKEQAMAEDLWNTEAVEANKLDLAETGLAGVSALINQNSKAGKLAAIAMATIDTWRGAQAAFAQTPGGIVAKAIAAASAGAIGLANVLKIKNTKIPGGGGDGGGSTGSASVPKIVNEAPKLAFSTQTQEIKAYIVEDDLSANASKQAKRNSVTTL